MNSPAKRRFVGFGFGAIQSGLFLLEASRSGQFSHFTVAEVDDRMVQAIRANHGTYTVNVAAPNGIQQLTVPGIQVLNPRDPADRAALLDAIAQADELATALPSVDFYDAGGTSSITSLLSQALPNRRKQHPAVIYTAENHNHAAEILAEKLKHHVLADALANVQILNTVIGKMSGVISDPAEMQRLRLTPITPATSKAILVEQFNQILITRITLPDFQRGIQVFQEKADLLPFEEAKLYGHNAIHALIGYLAHQRNLTTMAQVTQHPDLLAIAHAAFLEEAGAALIRKYKDLGDPLFTANGFRDYADDLLQRMVNPYLNDLVERVIRDPQRKLGWSDRIFGTMRLALEYGIAPCNMARGAAAAVPQLLGYVPGSKDEVRNALLKLWGASADSHANALIDLTWISFVN